MSKRGDKRPRSRGGSLHDAAVSLGRAGGKKGGPARASQLSPGERSAIARKGGKSGGRGR